MYRLMLNVNQVIYILDIICMPNIMIKAQGVLQIFCWQGPLWVKCLSLKRYVIQSSIHRTLWNVNQVIYIMFPNSMPDIVILAQAVLQMFCWQGCFTIQNAESEKEDNSATYLRIFTKTSSGHLHFGYNLYAKNHDHSSSSSPGILLTRSCMG